MVLKGRITPHGRGAGAPPAGRPAQAAAVRPRLGVFGDIVLDVVIVRREEAARDSDSRASITPRGGGSAANVAAWAAASGMETAFFGQVGDDPAGRALRDELRAAGVLVDPPAGNLLFTRLAPTGVIVVDVHGGARTMVTDRGANLCPPPGIVPPAALAACAWFHVTGYSFFEAGPREAARLATRRAARRASGGAPGGPAWGEARDLSHSAALPGEPPPFSVDPSSYRLLEEYGPRRFLDDVAGAEVVFPNQDEARVLTGIADPEAAARRLGAAFPVVVVKLGGEGCLVAAGRELARIPALRAPGGALDPTGAGDAFAAGFLDAYVGHRAAAAMASATAGTGFGAAGLAATRFERAVLAARAGCALAARAVSVVGGRPPAAAAGPPAPAAAWGPPAPAGKPQAPQVRSNTSGAGAS